MEPPQPQWIDNHDQKYHLSATSLAKKVDRLVLEYQYQLPSIYKHKELNLYLDLPNVTESARLLIVKTSNIPVTDSNVTLH